MDKCYSFIKSFKYALNGIAFCTRHERNIRVHLVATIYVLFFSQFYDFSRSELSIVILTCILVMSLEMVNTAIEVIIDKVSPNYSPLAKIGKDVAAGAVFIAAIAAIMVGIVLFWDIDTFIKIFNFFKENLLCLAGVLAFTVIAVIYIFTGKKRNLKGKGTYEKENKNEQ